MAMVDYCSFTKVLNTFRKVHCSLYSLLVNYRSITVVSGIAYCLNSSKIDLLQLLEIKIDPSYICFEIHRTPVLDSSCCGLVTTEVGLETGGSRLRHYGYSIDMLPAYKNCGKLERKKNMAMVDYCSFTKVLNTFRKVH